MGKLAEKYQALLKKYGLDTFLIQEKLHLNGTAVLHSFIKSHRQIAFYGYNDLTKRLMSEFIFELREVRYIIDESVSAENSGYTIISESEIDNCGIDGIILCCTDNVKEIFTRLLNNSPNLAVLPIEQIYGAAALNIGGPLTSYAVINRFQHQLATSVNIDVQNLIDLAARLIGIKDFRLAIEILEKAYRLTKTPQIHMLIEDLEDLYRAMLEVAGKKSDSVLLLCIDGCKYSNLYSLLMAKSGMITYQKGYRFTRAYSVSTSTFESLIPAYGENYDLRTEYYKQNILPAEGCRFVNEALKQGRSIHFYTDVWKFIDNDKINFTPKPDTAAEKLWDFLVDYEDTEYGLFYIHANQETHYSFPNPYTQEPLILNGTNILIDNGAKMLRGEKMQINALRQKQDAFRYIDDLVAPILEKLSCRTLIFADHGNYGEEFYSPDMKLEDIPKLYWSFAETLIRIPLVIFSPEMGVGECRDLISLMEFNDIVISLLNKDRFNFKKKLFIKVVRSELYNPEFRFLTKHLGAEHETLAFECFIFVANYKLAVYADGSVFLYSTENDTEVADKNLKKMLFSRVVDQITVCDAELCLTYLDGESKEVI